LRRALPLLRAQLIQVKTRRHIPRAPACLEARR
jgi:hypothetical protein